MNLKDPDRMKEEWWKLSPYLQEIIVAVNVWCLEMGVRDNTWTCFMRTEEEAMCLFDKGEAPAKTSVHCYGRGADMRLLQDEEMCNRLIDHINNKFGPYDLLRPALQVAMIHGGTAKHFHFQTLT